MASRVNYLIKRVNRVPYICYRCGRNADRVAYLENTGNICLRCVRDEEWPEKSIYVESTYGGFEIMDLRMDTILNLRTNHSGWYDTIKDQVAQYSLTKL